MTDDQIIEALRVGPKSNRELRVSFGLDHKKYNKQLDQALQRAQKTIRFDTKLGWCLAATRPCEHCQGTGRVPA